MTTKKIALLTFLALGVSGCGVMDKMGLGGMGTMAHAGCPGPVCHVDVSVEGCRVTVETETPVKRGAADTRIIWTVTTRDAEFTSNGIEIRSPGNVLHSPQHNGKHFKWDNRNPGPARFKYTVNVKQGDRICPPHDPFIVNL